MKKNLLVLTMLVPFSISAMEEEGVAQRQAKAAGEALLKEGMIKGSYAQWLPHELRQEAVKYMVGPRTLADAIIKGDSEEVKKILDAGGDPNIPIAEGTPLILAAQQGRSWIVDQLLDAGAHINAQDAIGWTALMHAIDKSLIGVVRSLVAKKADPYIKGANVFTPRFNPHDRSINVFDSLQLEERNLNRDMYELVKTLKHG